MTPATTAVLALGMSVDAFAAAVSKGAALDRPRLSEALRTGLIFGLVEALTPVLGWAAGMAAAARVAAVDHWIAFAILAYVGGRMVREALRAPASASGKPHERPRRHTLSVLLATAIGTSLDAMAVGVTLAFVGADITVAAVAIGLATAAMATLGMLLGRCLGGRFGRIAEALGGLALVALGTKILAEHTLLA
ncbi:MAG: manganese efflux pump [Acetobacteraceae bacterium]|nr:manganese efflux pump [Acetobacteraceae bacterium]